MKSVFSFFHSSIERGTSHAGNPLVAAENILSFCKERVLQCLLLFTFLLLSLANAPIAKSQGLSCADADPCPNDVWITFEQHIAAHPLFPNCTIAVAYYKKTCIDGAIYIKVTNYIFNELNPDCAALKVWLAGHPADYQLILESAIDKIARKNYNIKYDNNPLSVLCPVGQVVVTSYISMCNKFCRYSDTRPASLGGQKTYVVPLSCSNGSCCQIMHNICFDEATQTVIDTKTVTRLGPQILCAPGANCPATFTVQNPTVGTYDVPLSETVGCMASSCNP